MKSCGLYIHIPFCLRKCNYCDFVSFTYKAELADDFLLALFSEIELLAEEYDHPILETIYLGGGTPTCLAGKVLVEILHQVAQYFPIRQGAEITCELNPATGYQTDLEMMFNGGINRLSMGVQSFIPETLEFLGRIHSVEQVYETYHAAREVGFANINLDLIFAIPRQSREDWRYSLKLALELKPEHLSLYNLKIEEGTPLYNQYVAGRLDPVDDETDLWMYQQAIRSLQMSGYEHYEISNFARPGYASKHNLGYWHYQPFLALGPGAHGFDGSKRYENASNLGQYINLLERGYLPWKGILDLARKDLLEEYMFMGLRLLRGIDLEDFEYRFGSSLMEIYSSQVQKLLDLGLIALQDGRILLTEQGLYLGNEVFVEFLL